MRFILLFCLSSLSLLPASLLPEALQSFPAHTASFEYDNLSMLRKLPNYQDLRKQYSGEALQRARQTLLTLGISEDQLSEVVTASGPGGFFGLVTGSFQRTSVSRKAATQNFSRTVLAEGPAYCSSAGICVLFPSSRPETAAFGTLDQLHAVTAVRQHRSPAVGNNPSLLKLWNGLDTNAPVVGFVPGSEVASLLNSVMPKELSSRLDVSHWASSIEDVGYSVKIDTEAHVTAHILCTSETASKLLSGALNAASNLQRMAVAVGSSLSYSNLTAAANGSVVRLKVDAPLTK